MDNAMIIEMIGYLGSVLVLISFLMASVVKLRIINSAGGLIFAVYALLIRSYPTALMNFCLVGINLYYLLRLKRPDRHYTLLEEKGDSAFLQAFLSHYAQDIASCFPGIRVEAEKADAVFFVCHNMTPAGVLLGRLDENHDLEILLDYSTPQYRDCSVGKYLYSRLPEKGIRRLLFSQEPQKHEAYLNKMGFVKEKGAYVLDIPYPVRYNKRILYDTGGKGRKSDE